LRVNQALQPALCLKRLLLKTCFSTLTYSCSARSVLGQFTIADGLDPVAIKVIHIAVDAGLFALNLR